MVHGSEWHGFLNDFVTPRRPAELAMTHAIGQWRGASGWIEREPSEGLIVLHSSDPAVRKTWRISLSNPGSASTRRRFCADAPGSARGFDLHFR
ncbi:DUF3574 domain-containing protein [Microvirga lotononidis]|uniref:DUF3574 domain-containing protein n=1 Tax=Microvirga lotononidis TaxID=864069 RepID=UPI0018A8335E